MRPLLTRARPCPDHRRRDRRCRHAQHGTVTAELATLVPFALLFVLLLLWCISLGLTQVTLVDAAREGARSVARGTSVEEATALARRLAPANSSVEVELDDDGTVRVEVGVRSRPPLPFAEDVGTRHLSATAVAALEEP